MLAVFLLALAPLTSPLANPDSGLLAKAAKAGWIAEGRGPRLVYVIFDPNCPYCHRLYMESRAHLNGVQFRWIPVGILTPTSRAKAAALLQARDRAAALRKNETWFRPSYAKGGGIQPARHIHARTARELQQNYALLKLAGGPVVVPKMFFLGRKGRVQVVQDALDSGGLTEVLRDVAVRQRAR